MKKWMLALALALGLQMAASAPALALDVNELPGFQHKLYANGEPVAGKPGVLRTFIELRNARGFSTAELEDLKGGKYALNGFKDKLVLIDVWASWCEPCIRSLPMIKKLQERYNKPESPIRVVSVSVDQKKSDVEDFIKRYNLEGFSTLIDPEQKIGDDTPLDVVPSVFVLDGKGNLVGFVRGFVDWSDEKVPAYLEALAAKYAVRK